MAPIRHRMLVPLDGSPLAEVALFEALALAKLPTSEVILLQVVPPTEDVLRDAEGASLDSESRKATALQYLNGIASLRARAFATRTRLSLPISQRSLNPLPEDRPNALAGRRGTRQVLQRALQGKGTR